MGLDVLRYPKSEKVLFSDMSENELSSKNQILYEYLVLQARGSIVLNQECQDLFNTMALNITSDDYCVQELDIIVTIITITIISHRKHSITPRIIIAITPNSDLHHTNTHKNGPDRYSALGVPRFFF